MGLAMTMFEAAAAEASEGDDEEVVGGAPACFEGVCCFLLGDTTVPVVSLMPLRGSAVPGGTSRMSIVPAKPAPLSESESSESESKIRSACVCFGC